MVDLLGRTRAYQDANGQITSTTYDSVGRPIQINSPVGEETITYNADGTTGPTVLDGQTLATPHYDSAGRLDWVEYANGTRSEPVTRDALGRENSAIWKRTSDNAVLASNTVTRRLGGEITDETVDGHDANPTGPNYVYDTSGRLADAYTTARSSGGALSSVRTRYGFGPADAACPTGTRADAGDNTNRTSRTVGEGGTAATYRYCYDDADRLVSTTEPGVGTIVYDNHGNTTTIWGETRTYDASDRHTGTTKGSTEVAYRRDPLGRIIERTATGEPVQRYGFTGESDSPDLVLDASGNVTQKTIGLPGGGVLTTAGGTRTWSLPNVHGDIVTTTDDTGVPQGQAKTYDAFGVATGSGIPDNNPGGFDYGWLGQHQRPTEHADGLAATIEMGARQYDPVLGRFLEVDPVEGGSANDYDYVNADPRNQFDLDGTWCGWSCMKRKGKKLASRAWKRTRRGYRTARRTYSAAKGYGRRAWRSTTRHYSRLARRGYSASRRAYRHLRANLGPQRGHLDITNSLRPQKRASWRTFCRRVTSRIGHFAGGAAGLLGPYGWGWYAIQTVCVVRYG